MYLHAEKNSLFETEKDRTEWVGHDESIKVDNDRNEKVGAKETIKIAKDQTESVGNNRTIDVGTNDSLKVGQKIVIDAGQEITIKTGASKIVMKSDGTIEINGISITIEGAKSIDNKGALITSDASGMHTIKGSLVKIN